MSHAPKILVIDDDPAVRRLFDWALSQDGYSVACAAGGREALVLTRHTVFDLVVLDLSLCDMDGFRLLDEIRSKFHFARILVVSGVMKSFLHDIVRDAGAHAALAKPISPGNLRKRCIACSIRPVLGKASDPTRSTSNAQGRHQTVGG